MASEFELAIDQICEEKNISKEKVIETIEAALAAAYRKDYGEKGQNVEAKFDLKKGSSKIYEVQDVLANDAEIENPNRELTLDEAKKIKKSIKVGDQIKTDVTPKEISFGRIAAQTAKQVITQRIREAERDSIFDNFKDKEGTILNGVIQRTEKGICFIDLDQATGILLPHEQIPNESYRIGQRLKVYVTEVRQSSKGPEIILSRTHPEMVKSLFHEEVPEIAAGSVEIKSIAREAGSRSKIAVFSDQEGIDPVGSCVGQRGTRVQTIISELGGEKIDIIEWNENPVQFISNSLSPAKIISVKTDEDRKHAIVEVVEDQLSLAIGKNGQNVRLAVKLTGWKIDIAKEGEEAPGEKKDTKIEEKEEKKPAKKTTKKKIAKKDKSDEDKPKDEEKEEKPKLKKKEEKKDEDNAKDEKKDAKTKKPKKATSKKVKKENKDKEDKPKTAKKEKDNKKEPKEDKK